MGAATFWLNAGNTIAYEDRDCIRSVFTFRARKAIYAVNKKYLIGSADEVDGFFYRQQQPRVALFVCVACVFLVLVAYAVWKLCLTERGTCQ